MKLKTLFSKFTTSGLIATAVGGVGLKIGAAGLGFLNGIIVARLLGPEKYGVYTILMVTAMLTATIATLGLPTLITRQVATYVAQDQPGLLKGIINRSRQWVLLSSLVAIVVLMMLNKLSIFGGNLNPFALVVMFSLVPLVALNLQRAAILRGLHRVILADVPELILRPLLMIFMLGVCLTLIEKIDAHQAMLMQFIAVGISFVVGLSFVRRYVPKEVRVAQAETDGKQWIAAALPFFVITLVSTFQNQVALYILNYRTNSAQVGLFQVANQLVGLVAMGLMAVNLPLQPRVAAAWAGGDLKAIQMLVTQAVRLGTAIALVSCFTLMVFAESVLSLYGHAYQAAAPALRILVIGQLFNAVSGSCGLVLAMTGFQNKVLLGQCLALMVNSAAAWQLTHLWGAMGAAIGVTLGLMTWNSLLVISVLRNFRINTTILPFSFKPLVKTI